LFPPLELWLISLDILNSHTAGKSTVFGTALNYVACRLLGIDAEHTMMVRARATLHALGTFFHLIFALYSNLPVLITIWSFGSNT
jgi:hypothetical protein